MERFSLNTLPFSPFFQHPVLKFPLLSSANFYLPRVTHFAGSCRLHVPLAEHQAARSLRCWLRESTLLAFLGTREVLACSVGEVRSFASQTYSIWHRRCIFDSKKSAFCLALK